VGQEHGRLGHPRQVSILISALFLIGKAQDLYDLLDSLVSSMSVGEAATREADAADEEVKKVRIQFIFYS
jgi:hypothetical protein